MREAPDGGLTWAFGGMGLHWVTANYLPHNERSARLLERLGFERERYTREYLQTDGRWQDYVLTAKIRQGDSVGHRVCIARSVTTTNERGGPEAATLLSSSLGCQALAAPRLFGRRR